MKYYFDLAPLWYNKTRGVGHPGRIKLSYKRHEMSNCKETGFDDF